MQCGSAWSTAETGGVLGEVNDSWAFEAAVTADYDAKSPVERELVLRLASVLWRLRRATGIETALFNSVTSHKFSLRAHGSYRDVLESERKTPSGDDQRCIQKDIAESFLRLAEEPSRPIALLTRYRGCTLAAGASDRLCSAVI